MISSALAVWRLPLTKRGQADRVSELATGLEFSAGVRGAEGSDGAAEAMEADERWFRPNGAGVTGR